MWPLPSEVLQPFCLLRSLLFAGRLNKWRQQGHSCLNVSKIRNGWRAPCEHSASAQTNARSRSVLHHGRWTERWLLTFLARYPPSNLSHVHMWPIITCCKLIIYCDQVSQKEISPTFALIYFRGLRHKLSNDSQKRKSWLFSDYLVFKHWTGGKVDSLIFIS